MTENPVRDKGVRALIALASLMVVIAGLRAGASLLAPFMVSVFVAMLSLPLLNWLQNRRVPTPLAVLLTVLAVLAVLTSAGFLLGTSIRDFTREVPKYTARLNVLFNDLLAAMEVRGVHVSGEIRDQLLDPVQVMDLITAMLRGAASVLSNTMLVLLSVVFILSEAAGFPGKLEAAFGRRETSARFAAMRLEVQRFLGIKTLVSLATGSVVAGAMAIIGIDFPLLWGMLAFLLNFIPALGSIIASVPPLLLALVQFGPGHALAVGLVFLGVNVTLGNFVEPHLMGRRLGLSTLVVFFSLVFWGWVWGPVGMLLSVPLTMVIKIMLENTPDLRWLAVLLDAAPRQRDAAPSPVAGDITAAGPGSPTPPAPPTPSAKEAEGG